MTDSLTNWLDELKSQPAHVDVIDTADSKSQHTLDLFKTVIPALESGNKKFYSNLSLTEQDSVELWMLMRWATSVVNDTDQVLRVYTINDYVNKHFKNLTPKKTLGIAGHKELIWMLLSMACRGRKLRYKLIPPSKRVKLDRLSELISESIPSIRPDEIELLLSINSDQDIETWLRDRGYDDKTITDILSSRSK